MKSSRVFIILTLFFLLPFSFAACTSTITVNVTNTHPDAYVYLHVSTPPNVTTTITPQRVWLPHGATASFTLTLTSMQTQHGSMHLTALASGVTIASHDVAFHITCPHETVPSHGTAARGAGSPAMLPRLLLLGGFTLIWFLLVLSLAVWWKKRWLKREVLRILLVQRRKPLPAWLLPLLIFLFLTGLVLLILLLAPSSVSLITSLFA